MIKFSFGKSGMAISTIRKTSSGNVPRWLGLIFIIMGLLAVTFSYKRHRESQELQQFGMKTEAVVTDVDRHESHSRKGHRRTVTYYPIVQYTDQAGTSHTVESDTGVHSRTQYKRGDTVQVRYLEGNPERMEIVGLADPSSNYIFMAVGGVFVIAGVWITLFKRDEENEAPTAEANPEDEREKPQPPYPL